MRIGIYKDTLANRRGADVAVLALAEGLRERFDISRVERADRVEHSEIAVFEKKDFERRIKEPWDVIISTGTNELLDLDAWLRRNGSIESRNSPFSIPHSPFPIIQQFHTNPKSQFKWKRFVRNWKIRRALRCASVIQVLSGEFVPQVEKYGVPVRVIGNWSKFGERGMGNGERGIGNWEQGTEKRIIFPAAFAKGKNQKLLIEAFARVAGEFPDWRLRLLGKAEGRYADECRRLAEKMGGTRSCASCSVAPERDPPRIEFAGYCEDMAAEYERCAFVAFPSIDEGFPLTIADAAMFAKPCVMVKDWIGTSAAGGGVTTRPTVEAYAEGLRRLMADATLRQKMGEAARRFVSERYSRNRILDQWETLLRGVTNPAR